MAFEIRIADVEMLPVGIVRRKEYIDQSLLRTAGDVLRQVQEGPVRQNTVFENANAPPLFDYEEPPAAVTRMCNLYRQVQSGRYPFKPEFGRPVLFLLSPRKEC